MRLKLPLILSAAVLLGAVPAHAGTMPQFDFANPLLLSQVAWGAVIFVVMYAAFSMVGLPRVAGILAAREQTIGGDLERAQQAKQAADRAVTELNETRRQANAESQAALADAAERAKQAAAEQSAEVNARLETQLAASEARIAEARDGAKAALREAADDTAGALVARLTGRPAAPDVIHAAVGAALAARGLSDA